MTKEQPDHDGPVGMRQWMEWLIIQGVAVAMAGVMMMAFSLSNDQSAAKAQTLGHLGLGYLIGGAAVALAGLIVIAIRKGRS